MAVAAIVKAVQSVIGNEPQELHEPYIAGNEQKYVAECISSGHLSAGKWVERFEEAICQVTGAKHAVATCNGTSALYASLVCSGYGEWDTVKLPTLTFVATANACYWARCRIHFTELDETATLPVHVLGHKYPQELGYVRDACQAFGSDIPVSGLMCYSFNQNKIITTGGGGAVVTNDSMMADRIRHMITTARIPHHYKVEHDKVAWNLRMSDVSAAIGVAQIEQLPKILKAKKALAHEYAEAFSKIGIELWDSPGSNNWLNAIKVDQDQEGIITDLHLAGYKARMLPTPLHKLRMYKDIIRDDLSKSEELWRRVICLPSSPKLGMRYA